MWGLLLTGLPGCPPPPAAHGAIEGDTVAFRDGRLRVDVKRMALFDLLERISVEAGIEIFVFDSLDRTPVTLASPERPLSSVLGSLLGGRSYAVIYDPDADGPAVYVMADLGLSSGPTATSRAPVPRGSAALRSPGSARHTGETRSGGAGTERSGRPGIRRAPRGQDNDVEVTGVTAPSEGSSAASTTVRRIHTVRGGGGDGDETGFGGDDALDETTAPVESDDDTGGISGNETGEEAEAEDSAAEAPEAPPDEAEAGSSGDGALSNDYTDGLIRRYESRIAMLQHRLDSGADEPYYQAYLDGGGDPEAYQTVEEQIVYWRQRLDEILAR